MKYKLKQTCDSADKPRISPTHAKIIINNYAYLNAKKPDVNIYVNFASF